MNYDLGYVLYYVNDNNFVDKGKIQSIRTTVYKHREGYAEKGPVKVSKSKQYSFHHDSGWYWEDKCFESKEDAHAYANYKLKEEIETLLRRII